ncbi:MAG: FimV/HubP family polar landmark protein [Steroidobacteraceae bacterium]
MIVKRSSLVLASLMALPSAAFALGLGDIRLLSPLNAPLDAEIELVDVTPEEMQTLKAQIASRETFTRYGLDWPVFLSSVQVKTTRGADGRQVIKLKSTDTITEPFITLLVEVNWARGRLVREYTMLLDPPVYTPGQSPASNAPVAAPSAGTGAREGSIARESARDSGAVPPSQDTSSISPNPPGEPSGAAPAAPRAAGSSPTAASGSTHVVKRGETLSSIAASASGNATNSPQTRSWMLAIYQANPPAFEKNMNLLRSGAVLRIPEGSDVSAISPSEANGEIRRQYAAWRSSTPEAGSSPAAEPGRLRLVTPTESGSVGTGGPTPETKALQGRVKELEGQLSESKRLLEMRNTELAQLQSRLEGGTKAPAAAAPPPAAATAPPPAPAPAEQPPAAQAEAPAAAPPPAEEPAPSAEPTPTPPAADTTRAHRPPPTAAQAEGGGIFDTLKDYWWAIALLAVALAGFFGLRAWRSRRQSEFDDSLGRLAVAGANSMDRGFAAGGDTSPVRPLTAATDDGAFLVEESGTHERPRFGGGAAHSAASARHVSTADDTVSSDTAINLDQGDPLAEADFHMAYGLYDQAADLIRIAISREPNRRDLKLKLLEVFFVWGNKEQFLHSARELADTRAQAAPGEWEKIVIMGKQLAPEDLLFSGGGAVSGATAGGVDLDLEGGESRVDFDLLGEPVPGQNDGVDLDIGSALGETTHDLAGTDRNFGLESTYNNGTGTTRQMTQKLGREPEPLMPEFGPESEGPTVEQPQLNSQENPTIRQKVAMALKQGHSAEQTAELAIDDLGLDLGALDTVDQPGLGASSDAPTLVAGMDERSRKIMEEAQRRASTEDTSATAAWRMDDSDLHSVLGNGANGHAENGAFDPSSTARLAALSDRDVDFDLGDVDADGVGEADADGMHHHHHHAHGSNGSGLDLDVGTATVPDAAFTATQKLASDDLALPDLEPVTMSEVGTKLDLARAYMDMGDPEGARNILEEVMHEGSVAQKQEAQRLIESLPG